MNPATEVEPMLQLMLSETESALLRHAFTSIPDPAASTELALAKLLQTTPALPVDLIQQLLDFRANPLGATSALIRGLPIDPDLPPTPVVAAANPKPGYVSDLSLLLVAVLIGDPVAYRAEKDGVLVQNVFPVRANQDRPSNESSRTPLDFHTELVFSSRHPDRPLDVDAPDFVLLLCLRCPTDRAATTAIADASRVCAQLDTQQLSALREPDFQLRAPYSFTGDDDRPWSPPVPVLRGPDYAPSFAFDSACGTRALSAPAGAALAALSSACNDSGAREGVELRSGDLLVINNRRCAHARSSFPARFDGQDRWLQRAYVRRGVWPAQPESTDLFRVLA